MQQVEEWLKGDQDYDAGVLMYKNLGTDQSVKLLLNMSRSSFTEKKLLAAMKALLPVAPATEKQKLPDRVLELIRKRSIAHANLFNTSSRSDRKKLCFAILAITMKLDRYFDKGEMPKDQIDTLPDPVAEIPHGAWEMHQLFNNNRSYITKNKKSEDKKGEIARRETQNVIIEKRLKTLKYGVVQK